MGRGAFAVPRSLGTGPVVSVPFSCLKMEPSVEGDWSCRGGKGRRDAEAWRRGGAAASHCW